MYRTVFRIAKMDCPSEEALIRMKLDGLEGIRSLDFDIANRRLTVWHQGAYQPILQRLDSLNFDTSLLESTETDSDTAVLQPAAERKLLWQVLAVNLFLFVLEALSGILSGSMGLLADSLDMLADTLVYALALLAVGGTAVRKKHTAKAAGILQLVLALWGFFEVLQRFFGWESLPDFRLMIGISLLALAGNALCLYLLQKSKSREAHMQASMIFTANDVLVNLGVIAAGVLTWLSHSKYPDLLVGTLVFLLVGRGALNILKLSR